MLLLQQLILNLQDRMDAIIVARIDDTNARIHYKASMERPSSPSSFCNAISFHFHPTRFSVTQSRLDVSRPQGYGFSDQ